MIKNMGVRVFNGDIIILSLTTSDASGSVSIRGRVLHDDGQMVEFGQILSFSGTGTQSEQVMTLRTGWLIGFSVARETGTFTDGEVIASVHVGRNAGSLQQKLVCLASGDISNIRSLGLGGFTSAGGSVTTTEPVPTSRAVANPAPGADWTVTVPAGETWEFKSAYGDLTTSGTAATREVVVCFDDGTNLLMYQPAPETHTASNIKGYNIGNSGTYYNPVQSASMIISIPPIWLGPGWRIFTNTSNIQAGDQWSLVALSYLLH